MPILLNILRKICDREPDVIIGGTDNPYLYRWHVIPRNKYFNIYLHHFMRSDDDRALHDHPWRSCSILLDGEYIEHTPEGAFWRRPGAFYLRKATAMHRIELFKEQEVVTTYWDYPEGHSLYGQKYADFHYVDGKELPVWTLFLTGRRTRQWGFDCPQGWRHWKTFTASVNGSSVVGRGCD